MRKFFLFISLIFALISIQFLDTVETLNVGLTLVGFSLFWFFVALNINHLKN